jgi:hypothetical protein
MLVKHILGDDTERERNGFYILVAALQNIAPRNKGKAVYAYLSTYM